MFFDLIFAAAIGQLSTGLSADFSIHGLLRYAFLLVLIFFAWFGYTAFSTQYAVDDALQRIFIIGQVFLVAVMAANATDALSSRDAAGFGAAYGGVRAILALQYLRVIRSPDCPKYVRQRIIGLLAAAAIWAASAFLSVPARYFGWAFALLLDVINSWPSSHSTVKSPPGATHFPERFGLLTIILLGEFVASAMRGIESHMDWTFALASTAILSLALGFAIWSAYSDGAAGWKERHIRSRRDVLRLRIWICLHLALFLGIGVLGVGVRRAIALPADSHFSSTEQAIIGCAAAGLVIIVMGIGLTTPNRARAGRPIGWVGQTMIALLLGCLSLVKSLPPSLVMSTLVAVFLSQASLLLFAGRSVVSD